MASNGAIGEASQVVDQLLVVEAGAGPRSSTMTSTSELGLSGTRSRQRAVVLPLPPPRSTPMNVLKARRIASADNRPSCPFPSSIGWAVGS